MRLISPTGMGRLEDVKFIYTRHVRLRMQQRGLSLNHIEMTVRSPDRVAASFKDRHVAQKTIGRRTFEVVYKKLNAHVVLITAYWLE